MDIGSAVSRTAAGMTDEEIFAARTGDTSKFPAPEQMLLNLAELLTATPANVDNEFFLELRKHYSEEHLIELAAAIAHENFRSRFNRLFDVGSDEFFCPLPNRAADPTK